MLFYVTVLFPCASVKAHPSIDPDVIKYLLYINFSAIM